MLRWFLSVELLAGSSAVPDAILLRNWVAMGLAEWWVGHCGGTHYFASTTATDTTASARVLRSFIVMAPRLQEGCILLDLTAIYQHCRSLAANNATSR
jgi:hypothetical protein